VDKELADMLRRGQEVVRLARSLWQAAEWLRELRDSGGPDLTVYAHRKTAHEAEELAAFPTVGEWADVAICLVGTAIGQHWSPDVLAEAVERVVEQNRARSWAQQADGTWQHEEAQQ
jgi:hypothetical protein